MGGGGCPKGVARRWEGCGSGDSSCYRQRSSPCGHKHAGCPKHAGAQFDIRRKSHGEKQNTRDRGKSKSICRWACRTRTGKGVVVRMEE